MTQADFQIKYLKYYIKALQNPKLDDGPAIAPKNRPLQILTRLVRSLNVKEIDLKIFICVLVMYVMNVL